MPPSLHKRLLHEPPKTCAETKRLELGYLARKGLLRPGVHAITLSWNVRGQATGDSIHLESYMSQEAGFLRLRYRMASGVERDYEIELVAVPSNLPGSTAQRYYMVCPVSGQRATILYLRAGTDTFIHRQAYTDKRLYYESQLEVKRFRKLARYFKIDQRWREEYLRDRRKTTYRGKPTKWFTKLLDLQERSRLEAQLATNERNLWP